MTTLDQFTDEKKNEPPTVIRGEPVTHIHHESGMTTVVGHLAKSNYGPAYMTTRQRSDHLYGQRNSDPESWALSNEVLVKLEANDVEQIFVFETEEELCYNYPAFMFLDSEYPHSLALDFEDGDPQTAVPVVESGLFDAKQVTLQL